ncbi:DUF5986 family protein [Bacillus cereus]|uniref:DUF5986 family protein n=2 Tax=Bacillus cereus TaxID=1396 RepID=UPI002406F675|nr:DUF5986 family protein [Bacillus cereus]MDF9520783.1 DUF5986 family protein [Bacillus cereus]MDF9563796.1 DUF5986 family protein [Bacillus cereus]
MHRDTYKMTNIELKRIFTESIKIAYEVDYRQYKRTYFDSPTGNANNKFIRDRIYEQIDKKIYANENYEMRVVKRGSEAHILVFDKMSYELYCLVSKDRYKVIKKEAIDPEIPPHYAFIYAQPNPEEVGHSLFSIIDDIDFNNALVVKKEHAKEKAKEYLFGWKVMSSVLIVYDFDKFTENVSTIEAFRPSSLNLIPINGIDDLTVHRPIFTIPENKMASQNSLDNDQQTKQVSVKLKTAIKNQLQGKEKPILKLEKKKDIKGEE